MTNTYPMFGGLGQYDLVQGAGDHLYYVWIQYWSEGCWIATNIRPPYGVPYFTESARLTWSHTWKASACSTG